ncbi:polysaccharide deacetylase [Pseudomonas sp. LP_7_YM]|uniref:polysaccharide deacetylase family protein n=1 Tax=Pseudomonas sp. LP_7_YM TaxID=2485137 RepID=UPI00105FA605|nr:polysaccharide deacetylase [Pseudomonas sp. LP_7_YM]TDV59719.1 polysaccharide deacetylase [Pseudomonas sp. LP_7_YM]
MTDAKPVWPGSYRCAVVITIDYNDIHGILTQVPAMAGRDKSLSVWRYGTTRGVQRVLEVLSEQNIRASWCIPGIVAEENPKVVRAIHAAGHEIACAGYRHEDFSLLTLAQQRESIRRGCDVLEQVTGLRPSGFRAPAGSYAPGLSDALCAEGITWSSSWAGDDLPYLHPCTRADAAPLVELPLHCELEDEPYFAFNLAPAVPASQARIGSYAEVLKNWQQDFAGFHRFGLCYVMRLHPEILGTVGRSGLLTELLSWLKAQPDVWFASAEEVADWWSENHSHLPDDHPAAVYTRHAQSLNHD